MRLTRYLPLVLLGSLVVPTPATAAPTFLQRGFVDDVAFFTGADRDRRRALTQARLAGGSLVRVTIGWRAVAPPGRRKPRGFRASDPTDRRYVWAALDRAVREVTRAGHEPLMLVHYAPDWAEGRGRRRQGRFKRLGVWRPQPRELAAFMTAAARRYDGTFADPARPRARLPRARYWQVWNEPNIWPFLQPQWERRDGRWVAAGARHYRRMLNASYRALKRVDPTNQVISGGLAPFGDRRPTPVGGRLAPARFWRVVLCLRGRRVLRRACRLPTAFDAHAFHPYSLGGPGRRALNPDDTTIPDAYKLTRLVRAALRMGTARPRRPKALWVTEMGWDTRPANPFGLRPQTHARYLNDALFVLWRSGVSRVSNYLMRDSGGKRPRRPIDPQRRQSGVFLRLTRRGGYRRKPAFLSLRFPFVVQAIPGGESRAWGVPPCAEPVCTVVIERGAGGRWIPVTSLSVPRGRVFLRTVRASRHGSLRARIADTRITSLPTRRRRL